MTTISEHDTFYSWLRLAITLLIAIVGNIGMWVIILVLPSVQTEFGVDRASASLPFTFTMVGFALGNYYMGKATDRFNISLVLLFSSILLAICFVIAANSNSIMSLSFIQLVIGFGTGASFGPVIADISLWFMKRRGIAVALAASGNYLSGAIWPLLTKDLLLDHGWRTVYLVLALASIMIMAPLSLALKRKISNETNKLADSLSANKAKTIEFSPKTLQILLGLAGLGCCVAMSMPQVHIVAFCVDLGFGSTAGSQMLSFMLIGGIASRLISGILADKIGGLKTLLLGSSLQCLALFLYLPFNGLTFPIRCIYNFWVISGRNCPKLCSDRKGISSCKRGGSSRRTYFNDDYCRNGLGGLVVRLDFRCNRFLLRGVCSRYRVERS